MKALRYFDVRTPWGIGVLLALLASPLPAAGQSLFSGGGLGLLNDPLEARARGLGGVAIGLSGWHISATDPAAAGGLILPTATATLQPSTVAPEGEAEAGGSRFPSIGASYPYGRHVFTLQFASFLDQEWRAGVERELEFGGETVQAIDRYESTGGIGQARLGWAMRTGPSLAVGLHVGSYVGSVERHFSRQLDPSDVGPGVEAYRAQGRWRASGALVAAGAIWDPSPFMRFAASLEWSGDLTLDPVAPTGGQAREYPMPLTLRAGGTFDLGSDLALAVSGARADWSGIDEALGEGGGARDVVWSYGAGLEWDGASLLGRTLPLRAGWGQRHLPFHFDGESASESALSAGIGMNLLEAEPPFPVAQAGFGIERGSRSAGPLSEDFWRFTLSIRVAGG